MQRALVSVLMSMALIPTAFAGKDAALLQGAAEVELSAAVEVPLYRAGEGAALLPAVRVTGAQPEEEGEVAPVVFATLDLAQGWTTVDKGTAEKLGGKVKKGKIHGQSVELTVLPELHLAEGLVLRDVAAEVTGKGLVLGLATLEEVGVAVLPAAGTVKFVPAAEAAALVSGLGAALPMTALEGKWFEHGSKEYGNGLTLAVEGGMAAHKGLVRVATAEAQSRYSRFGESAEVQVRSRLFSYACGTLGAEQTAKGWLLRDESLIDPQDATAGLMGYDLLYTYDLALDPVGRTLSVKPAATQTFKDAGPELLQIARDAFAKPDKAAEGEEGEKAAEAPAEGAPAEEAKKGQNKGDAKVVGKEMALANALWAADLYDEALPHYKAAADAAGDQCKPAMVYGQKLLATHDAEGAAPLFEKAGVLWDNWYAQDLKIRQKLADEKKAKKVEAEFDLVQDASCHQAWGYLAAAKAALGDHAAVEQIYTAHVALDARLSMVYGLDLVAQGKLEAANGPLRRAMNQRVVAERVDHLALAAAHATPEGAVVFDRQVEALVQPGEGDLGLYMGIVELARKQGGDAKAKAVAEQLVALDPHAPEGHIMAAVIAVQSGASPADALAKVRAAHGHDAEVSAAYLAIADALEGKVDAAAAHIANYGGPSAAMEVHIARTLIGYATGEAKVVKKVGDCLADLNADDPTAALGLISKIPYSGPLAFLEDTQIRLWENVQFVSGSAELSPASAKMLDEVAAILVAHPELLKIEVAGHTDSEGDDAMNQTLSEQRAVAVMNYLVGKGIVVERLGSAGYGETTPLQSNDSAEGREANRRVEFRIVTKG